MLPSLLALDSSGRGEGDVRRLERLAEVWILNKFTDTVWKRLLHLERLRWRENVWVSEATGTISPTFTVPTEQVGLPPDLPSEYSEFQSVLE